MTAVGDAAFEMINEIRRQFKEIPGLLEGNAEPDTAKCVDIATSAALKRMLLPGVIAVSAPAIVGFGLRSRIFRRNVRRRINWMRFYGTYDG